MTAAGTTPALTDTTAGGPHILVVDDDERLCRLLCRYLRKNDFRVTIANGAAEARRRLSVLLFDLIVMDVMMPGESGLELTAWLRRHHRDMPVLMLTAMGDADDRIAGLELGADDYLPKPYEPRELVARIRSILRRAAPAPVRTEPVGFGDCRFEPAHGRLFRAGRPVHLTEAEAGLLRIFAESAGQTLSREELVRRRAVKGNIRTVDVQITRLRRKIEADPRFPQYLQTVRGQGYVLRTDPPAADGQ